MGDLEPITRNEKLWSGEDLTPVTRREMYIKHLYDETQVIPEYPVTREEMFILKAGEELHDVTIEQLTATENKTYSEEGVAYSPVIVNVPLPENAYLLKEIEDVEIATFSDGANLPMPKLEVGIDSACNGAKVINSSDGVINSDNAPYTYRATPYNDANVLETIVGGTVAWNQQLSLSNLPSDSALYSNTTYTVNGVTFTKNNDGSITIQTESGGATSEAAVKIGNDARLAFMKNHIHYISRCKGGSASTYYFVYAGNKYIYDNDKIFAKQPSEFNMWLVVTQGTVITTPVKVYPQVVDLEQMFGSTIADYIYSLEQATAGSGIAWLKANGFLTKNYYPYDAGSLQSVKTSGRKIVGKNLFDKTKYSSLNSDYDYIEAEYNCKRIQLKPNTTYMVSQRAQSIPTTLILLNKYSQVNRSGYFDTRNTSLNATFTTDESGCLYIGANNATDSAISQRLDECEIQIELGTTATSYEPYKEPTTYPLSPIDLRGILKLDSNNNLYYDGDIYESDGSVKRKYGIVDLGTLTWTYQATNKVFYTINISDYLYNSSVSAICSKYEYIGTVSGGTASLREDEYNGKCAFYYLSSGVAREFYVKNLTYTDADTFKTAMNGVYLVYELATSTSETADAYENPQLVGSTEEFVDAGTSASTPTRDVDIPCGHNSLYYNGNGYYVPFPTTISSGTYDVVDGTITSGQDEYNVNPLAIKSLQGLNNVFADSGNILDLSYLAKEE